MDFFSIIIYAFIFVTSKVDGEQAYDRCQWDWLDECLEAMAFPDSFRGIVRMLYTNPELRIKVNGVSGDAFSPLNGVKQGCPLSPFLYLICLQPLIDTLESASSAVPGVRVPGPLGRGTIEAVVTAYADDLTIFLRGFHGLAIVGPIMEDYHLAAGAATKPSRSPSGGGHPRTWRGRLARYSRIACRQCF